MDRPGELCDHVNWRRRGWCRFEYLATTLARTVVPVMVVASAAHARLEFGFGLDALQLPPGLGAFTCCARGHDLGEGIQTAACDHNAIAPVLSRMVDTKIESLWERGDLFGARLFIGLKRWIMRGLSRTGGADAPAVATGGKRESETEEFTAWAGGDGVKKAADAAEKEEEAGLSGPNSGLDFAYEQFRWRDDDYAEARETRRTGATLLFWCALSNNLEAVRALASESDARSMANTRLRGHRPDIFGMFTKGTTALHAAASVGSWDVVEALLNLGAKPTAKTVTGTDALMCMAVMGRVRSIERWCVRFPDWNMKRGAGAGNVGLNALGMAISQGPNKMETVRALLAAGADPCAATSAAGTNVLHNVACNKDANELFVKYILTLSGGEGGGGGGGGGVAALVNTPMKAQNATWKIRYAMSRLKMKLGGKAAMLRTVSEWSMITPVALAARNGNAVVAKVLVEDGGADMEVRNAQGISAQGFSTSCPEILKMQQGDSAATMRGKLTDKGRRVTT